MILKLEKNQQSGHSSFLNYFKETINNLEEGTYEIEIRKIFSKTKNDYLKLYFLNVKEISNHLGYSKQEVHEIMKNMFLLKVYKNPENINTENYEELTISTKFLSFTGWEIYLKFIKDWAFLMHNIIL